MERLVFSFESDEGFLQAEWWPEEASDSFPRGWDWWLDRGGKHVNSLDTYTCTASLGALDPGQYRLRLSPKEDASFDRAWRGERETIFQVTDGGSLIGETELRLSRILDRVGQLINERDALQRLLEQALSDLELARSTVDVLALQLESLKSLGALRDGGGSDRSVR